MATELSGNLNGQGQRLAIVLSRFNSHITERLLEGALDALGRHGVDVATLTIARCPGAWELPLICQKLAETKRFDGILALGCVIRGDTPHFDYVAAECSKGIAQVSWQSGIPVTFSVLTTDTVEQALDRAGLKSGNKGFDGACALIETVNVLRQLS